MNGLNIQPVALAIPPDTLGTMEAHKTGDVNEPCYPKLQHLPLTKANQPQSPYK
jgi:hypothetical protein